MNYDMTTPCVNCPFRKDIPPYLRGDRVRDIQRALVRGEFPCHKTTVPDDSEDGELTANEDSKHCAGALILMEKAECPSQMMRICGRLGMYDRTKLNMDAPVFDDWESMIDAQDE